MPRRVTLTDRKADALLRLPTSIKVSCCGTIHAQR
jgi:hypothetical protein